MLFGEEEEQENMRKKEERVTPRLNLIGVMDSDGSVSSFLPEAPSHSPRSAASMPGK